MWPASWSATIVSSGCGTHYEKDIADFSWIRILFRYKSKDGKYDYASWLICCTFDNQIIKRCIIMSHYPAYKILCYYAGTIYIYVQDSIVSLGKDQDVPEVIYKSAESIECEFLGSEKGLVRIYALNKTYDFSLQSLTLL